jgi:hypothetical protein
MKRVQEPTLDISDELALPLSAVTESIAILAVRGAGKSNAAVRIAEQMHAHNLHWVAIDPKGDWWGIRSGADGTSPGLPIPVFGGQHGDIPLEPGSGALIADLIVDQRLTCVLDVSDFASEAEKVRFLLAFSAQLYKRKSADQEPTHVFFEEADDYCPQRAFPEQARLVHAMARLLKQGRSRGLGVSIISQRSAVVNKDVLTQAQTLIALRTTSPQDRKAIEGWVSYAGENDEIVSSLHQLKNGEAWVWSPTWLGVTQRIQFKRRETFDSGATPAPGRVRTAPSTLADIDLGAVRVLMAETIERQEAEDPKRLRQRIASLEAEVKELIAKPRLRPFTIPAAALEVFKAAVDDAFNQFQLRVILVEPNQVASAAALVGAPAVPPIPKRPDPSTPKGQARINRELDAIHAQFPGRGAKLTTLERKVLTVLAQHQGLVTPTRQWIALLVGYHQNSKSMVNTLGTLRTAGYVEGVTITPAGVEALGEYEQLPTGGDLLIWYYDNKLTPVEGRIAMAIAERDNWGRTDLAERVGYHPNAKSFVNALGRLRSLHLVDGLKLSAVVKGTRI